MNALVSYVPLFALLAACGGSPPAPNGPAATDPAATAPEASLGSTAADPDAAIVLRPFTVRIGNDAAGTDEIVIRVTENGEIIPEQVEGNDDKVGQVVATVTADGKIITAEGKQIAVLSPDGTLTIEGADRQGRYASGTVSVDDKPVLTIGDDGRVRLEGDSAVVHTDAPAEAHATAALVILSLLVYSEPGPAEIPTDVEAEAIPAPAPAPTP